MEVRLNVYDLHEQNEFLFPLGLGMYHSGVEIRGTEYTFASGAGIFNMPPKSAPNKFRESILVGIYRGSLSDIDGIINSLRRDFSGDKYHILNRNCNSFAEMFVLRLLNIQTPGWVNRMAFYGSLFSCFLPDEFSGNAPVNQESSSDNSSSNFTSKGIYNNSRNNNNNTKSPFGNSAGRRLGD